MDDLISRQTAIGAICTEGTRLERNGTVAMAEIKQWCVDILEALPPAQPERKTGKWKGYNADNPKWLRDDGSPVFLECSACNTIVMNNGSAYWNFCPNCGVDMKGEADGR